MDRGLWKTLISIGLNITLVFVIYIFLIYGDKKDIEEIEWLKNTKFAHRGLYSNDQLIPENSLAAFDRAIENN